MSNHLSNEEMTALEQAHGKLEWDLRFEDVMETIVEEPYFELHPAGYILRGRPAVDAFYRRLMPKLVPMVTRMTRRSVGYGETSVTSEDELVLRLPSGEERVTTLIVVMTFEGKLVSGERLYADRHYTDVFMDILGPDFACLPGVSRW